MKKLITRPRSLPIAVAFAVGAALCTVSTANAASSASETVVPAAPSNLTAKAASTTSVHLTWTNKATNQSGVVISLDGVKSVDLQGATVSSYTWNGLSRGTKYWFYVASKIYGTPGDPTGPGNTQSAWVGPVYATTPKTSAAPSTQCNFVLSLHTCQSTDPTVAYYDSTTGDISHCTFVFDVAWGDGGSTTKVLTDPPAGHNLVGKHAYTRPKAYTITVTVKVTVGTCTGTNSVHTFTSLVAKQIVPVPAGKAHVKGHVVYDYRVSGKKVSAALFTPACALAIGEFDIKHAVVESIIAFVPNGLGKLAVLILTTVYDVGDLLNACVPTQLKHHVK
jgi:hypothetical protein